MSQMVPDFFWAGPNKSGSTWSYTALSEHPDICMSREDPVNFFDVNYYKGLDWYRSTFDFDGEAAVGDESPGYIKSLHAPERIHDLNPDAKIIFCLRNPVERAFSQWWYGRTKWHQLEFSLGLRDHEVFDYLIVPGFYDRHITRWEAHFSEENLLITFFDDFRDDDSAYIRGIYEFVGVDPSFEPSVLDQRVNTAPSRIPDFLKTTSDSVRKSVIRFAPNSLKERVLSPVFLTLRPYYHDVLTYGVGARREYERGMDPEIRKHLEMTYAEDVRALQRRTDRNLSHWFEHVEL